MAIYQHKKDSDLEKRLQLLRRQIYGKGSENSERLRKQKTDSVGAEGQNISKSDDPKLRFADSSGILSNSESFRADISYLYQDLFRIGIIASLALGLQIVLFLLSRNQIINLNFF